jgi:serine/threonine protein kinase
MDFLAMELIQGTPLSSVLTTDPLPEKEIQRLGMQLADGLAAAHAQGVIHRDLKPANLMIMPDGRLKILDFGLAVLMHPERDTDVTRTIAEPGMVAGTLPYMPPEQLRGLAVDSRSDIYAAGVVLYEMAAGQRPFPQSQSAELIGAILHQPTTPPGVLNPKLTPALQPVVTKSLEREPAQRYQSARELLVALEGLNVSGGTKDPSTSFREDPLPGSGRSCCSPLEEGDRLGNRRSYIGCQRASIWREGPAIPLALET